MKFECVDDQRFEMYRQLTGAEKLKLAFEISSSVRRMLVYYLCVMYPDWTDGRLNRQAARIMSDEDIHGDDCGCCHGM